MRYHNGGEICEEVAWKAVECVFVPVVDSCRAAQVGVEDCKGGTFDIVFAVDAELARFTITAVHFPEVNAQSCDARIRQTLVYRVDFYFAVAAGVVGAARTSVVVDVRVYCDVVHLIARATIRAKTLVPKYFTVASFIVSTITLTLI